MRQSTAIDDNTSVPPVRMDVDDGDTLRAGVYRLFGQLLAAPPSTGQLDELTRIDDSGLDDQGREGSMAGVWQALKLAGGRATVESVSNEYSDLFVGLSRGELVPYGSWYMTGLLMDQPLVVLRRDLAELGIKRKQDVFEPEDHISALCEAMSLVIESPDIPFEAQQKFFNCHLAPWAIQFFTDLQQAKSAGFYRVVGLFGERFFEFECRYLSMAP
jgi:TorA maturation chaperone TorD